MITPFGRSPAASRSGREGPQDPPAARRLAPTTPGLWPARLAVGLVGGVVLSTLVACADLGSPGMPGLSYVPPRLYTVAPGDTVYDIARRFNLPMRAIIQDNRLQPPFVVQVGQVLRLPGHRVHVVQPGETVYGLSRRYGVDMNRLARLNGLGADYLIRVDQALVIPDARQDRTGGAAVAAGPAWEPAPAADDRAGRHPLPMPGPEGQATAGAPLAPLGPIADAPAGEDPASPFDRRRERGGVTGGAAAAAVWWGEAPGSAADEPPPPVALGQPRPPVGAKPLEVGEDATSGAGPTPPAMASPPPAVGSVSDDGAGGATPASPSPPDDARVAAAPSSGSAAGAGTAASAPSASAKAPVGAPPPREGAFGWPVRGAVLVGFGPTAGGLHNDGLNIAAGRGTPVQAAEAGVVAYAGNEIRGYGNLLLVKHEGGFMTAYAHLDQFVVGRGAVVGRGQVIGRVGVSGGVDQPQLHFEIRKSGQPVDPKPYLDGRRVAGR